MTHSHNHSISPARNSRNHLIGPARNFNIHVIFSPTPSDPSFDGFGGFLSSVAHGFFLPLERGSDSITTPIVRFPRVFPFFQGQVESLLDSFCQVGQFLDPDRESLPFHGPERAVLPFGPELKAKIGPILIDVPRKPPFSLRSGKGCQPDPAIIRGFSSAEPEGVDRSSLAFSLIVGMIKSSWLS